MKSSQISSYMFMHIHLKGERERERERERIRSVIIHPRKTLLGLFIFASKRGGQKTERRSVRPPLFLLVGPGNEKNKNQLLKKERERERDLPSKLAPPKKIDIFDEYPLSLQTRSERKDAFWTSHFVAFVGRGKNDRLVCDLKMSHVLTLLLHLAISVNLLTGHHHHKVSAKT